MIRKIASLAICIFLLAATCASVWFDDLFHWIDLPVDDC